MSDKLFDFDPNLLKIEGPIPEDHSEVTLYKDVDPNDEVEIAKQNIKEILEVGKQTVKDLSELAKSTEHPRMYEVLNATIDTIIKGNASLIDSVTKQLQGKIPAASAPNVTNNTIILSTNEMLKRMLELEEDKKSND